MPREKFQGERIEEMKQAARLEEQLPDADRCPACAEARKASGDPTDLCREHLKKVYGV
jgi:hypothetical protein